MIISALWRRFVALVSDEGDASGGFGDIVGDGLPANAKSSTLRKPSASSAPFGRTDARLPVDLGIRNATHSAPE